MLKKKMSILLTMVVLCLSACGEEAVPETEVSGEVVESQENTVQESEKEEEADKEKEVTVSEEEWGFEANRRALFPGADSSEGVRAYINFPKTYARGNEEYTAIINVKQGVEKSFAIFDAQTDSDEEVVNSLEEVFPAYFPRAVKVMESSYSTSYSDFAFEITGSELTEVNGMEMCKYKGINTYNKDGVAEEKMFVAYSAQASNGAYVYWMVFGVEDEKILEEDAAFIAQTFRETP